MKKLFMVLAATLICGASVFTSCSKDKDNNNNNQILAEKLVGKWQPVATDFAEYFVDGTLLCTRWQYPGSTEQRLNVFCRSYENGTLVTNQTVERNGHLYTYTYTSTVTR